MASYADDHADARAAIADAGSAVTFTLANQGTYDASTDRRTPAADTTVTGVAVEKKGSLTAYQALSLIVAKARTLFFVPDTFGSVPALDSSVAWGGESYITKSVAPLSINGTAIAATIIVSR